MPETSLECPRSLQFFLLPGYMADAALWAEVVPQLSAIGTVSYGDINEGTTLEQLATRTLRNAPQRFVLVGFSMGGYVARTIAQLAPERVAALILVATSSRPDTPRQVAARQAAVEAARRTGAFRGLSMAAIKASVHPDRAGDLALLAAVREMGVRLGPEVFATQSSVVRPDTAGTLGRIACPTLVVAADADQLRSREESNELVAGIPDAELVVIANSGHMVPMEQPHQLGEAIHGWLRKRGLVP